METSAEKSVNGFPFSLVDEDESSHNLNNKLSKMKNPTMESLISGDFDGYSEHSYSNSSSKLVVVNLEEAGLETGKVGNKESELALAVTSNEKKQSNPLNELDDNIINGSSTDNVLNDIDTPSGPGHPPVLPVPSTSFPTIGPTNVSATFAAPQPSLDNNRKGTGIKSDTVMIRNNSDINLLPDQR